MLIVGLCSAISLLYRVEVMNKEVHALIDHDTKDNDFLQQSIEILSKEVKALIDHDAQYNDSLQQAIKSTLESTENISKEVKALIDHDSQYNDSLQQAIKSTTESTETISKDIKALIDDEKSLQQTPNGIARISWECMSTNTTRQLIDRAENTIVIMPAKAAGTTMKLFADKCNHASYSNLHLPGNLLSEEEDNDIILTNSWEMPGVITR